MGMMEIFKNNLNGLVHDVEYNLKDAGTALKRGARKTKKVVFGSTANTASDAQELELADARTGIIYFLGASDIRFTPISFGSIATAVVGDFGINVGGFKTLAGDVIGNTVGRVPGAKTGWKGFKDEVASGAKDLFKPIKDVLKPLLDAVSGFWMKFADLARPVMKGLIELFSFVGTTLISTLAGSLASAAPGLGYVDDAVGMVLGIRKGVMNSWNLFKMNKAGEGMTLLGGHPQQILKALQRHYVTQIAGGAWATVQSAGTTAIRATADGGGFGTGAIVGLVTSVLSKIVSLIDRIAERVMLGFVLSRARHEWRLGAEHSPLIRDHKAFCSWFGGWLTVCPVLAAVVLQSGVAAHPMRFVQLLGADATDMGEGARYVNRLKVHAGKYLSQHRDEYGMQFKGRDALTRNRLLMAYGATRPAFAA